jgi:hypothetical protein
MTATADLIENTKRYNEFYSVLLPISKVATAAKAICKYFCGVSGCDYK